MGLEAVAMGSGVVRLAAVNANLVVPAVNKPFPSLYGALAASVVKLCPPAVSPESIPRPNWAVPGTLAVAVVPTAAMELLPLFKVSPE